MRVIIRLGLRRWRVWLAGWLLHQPRDAKGRFKDIQTYKRAHASDVKRKAKTEK